MSRKVLHPLRQVALKRNGKLHYIEIYDLANDIEELGKAIYEVNFKVGTSVTPEQHLGDIKEFLQKDKALIFTDLKIWIEDDK